MRVEIVVRFVVAIDDEVAQKVDMAGITTHLGQMEFLAGTGNDRSVLANATDVEEYDTVSVERLDDPAQTPAVPFFNPSMLSVRRGDRVPICDGSESREEVISGMAVNPDEPIVLLADGTQCDQHTVLRQSRERPDRLGVRELTQAEVEFFVECLPELDVSPDGHCTHWECEECCTWVRDQLAAGNEWAWCTVRVVARWHGITGDDSLGCCSYESEEQFRQPGGYFDDMKSVALTRLNVAVIAADQLLTQLRDSTRLSQ